jgi:hypothetical protein
VPGVLIGWLTGYFDGHLWAAILWGLCILFIYIRQARKRFDSVIFTLALVQAVAGGLITYYIGVITH